MFLARKKYNVPGFGAVLIALLSSRGVGVVVGACGLNLSQNPIYTSRSYAVIVRRAGAVLLPCYSNSIVLSRVFRYFLRRPVLPDNMRNVCRFRIGH